MKNLSIKSVRLLIAVLFISSLISCGPDVYFKQALPPEIDAATEIPSKYCGLYVFESDSSGIIVQPDMILTETIMSYRTTLSKVEESENCKIVDGGLHLRGREQCLPFEYINDDTILVKVSEMDTLFSFDEGQVLKFYEDDIYLNFLNAKDEWITMVLKEDVSGGFRMYIILISNTEEEIRPITDNFTKRYEKDSTEVFIINPSAQEFQGVIKPINLRLYDVIIPLKVANYEK